MKNNRSEKSISVSCKSIPEWFLTQNSNIISMRQKDNHIKEQIQVRACLKNHSRNLYAPLCGIFHPNSVAVAHYGALIRAKYPTNCDAHLAGMIFQTRSNVSSTLFYTCRFFCISSLNSLPLNNITATRNRKHINAPNILTVGFFTTLHKSKIPGRINPYPAAIIS